MPDQTVQCPNCGHSIPLTEALAAPLLAADRARLQQDFAARAAQLETRQQACAAQELAADAARRQLDQDRAALAKERDEIAGRVADEVARQRAAVAEEEARRARRQFEDQLAAIQRQKDECDEVIRNREVQLAEARQAELEHRRKQRELDDRLAALDLELEKRLAAAVGPEREKARRAADDEYRLKLDEERAKNQALVAQLAEAQRRAQQGSQQLQGEVLELDLERRLQAAFPRDTLDPVPKGRHGGDVLQRVLGPLGQVCGTILWEAKRTKGWSNGWTDKLKQDQRAARADLAVIVSLAMPPGVETFAEVDGVWVATPALAVPLAAVLRHALGEAALARRAAEGQQDKMTLLYQYLTGPAFRQRVEALTDAFTTLQADLDAEKRAITKQWARRQQQIERVMASTAGMYGDLQAIAGRSLPEIGRLEFTALDAAPPSAGPPRLLIDEAAAG
jgi:hypothetical protein